MKKKTWVIIALIFVFLIVAAAIVLANRSTSEDEMTDMLNQIENVLGEEWEKQTVTKVSDLVYSDNEGNHIIYHICATTYFEADIIEQTVLNTNAISTVIDPDEAESCRECTISGLPAAIYQKDGQAYLCWTITPELSCVIEYDPAVECEKDMFRMAESVPANQSK